MQQRARLKALDRFKNNENAVLVASDVAARGLDVTVLFADAQSAPLPCCRCEQGSVTCSIVEALLINLFALSYNQRAFPSGLDVLLT